MAATTASPLPPGPRLPRWLQTMGFIFVPVRWIDRNRRKYGDVVTFRSLFHPGFVMVFHPDLVKQVFRGPPDQLRAGEANAVLGPVLGDRSVLLLDGAEHMRQRKLLLPPFHGERMRAYEQTDARTRRPLDRHLAPGRALRAAAAHAGHHARRDHARGLRRRRRRAQARPARADRSRRQPLGRAAAGPDGRPRRRHGQPRLRASGARRSTTRSTR